MASETVPALSLDDLRSAVAGGAAAFRLTLKLEPVSPKVFPPTYEGGKYAVETRRIEGKDVPCVLLDSVPSQANRMEWALQHAWQGGEVELPVISVDFSGVEKLGVPKITSLQAPHRIADAILRDSFREQGAKKVKFRQTEIGKALERLNPQDATPLLQYAPHCLVFGMWDSTGPRGGLGVKFARAVVSEIIGVNAVPGVTTSSRIDPLGIQKLVDKEEEQGVRIYRAKDGGWTLRKEEAELDQKKNPILFGKKGKPSEINHGNVTPSIVYRKKSGTVVEEPDERPVVVLLLNGDENGQTRPVARENKKPVPVGGFTVDYAEQTTVLSLPALRRLRFPKKPGERSSPEADLAARTYLAALGLLGATLAAEDGYDLRSRCILRAPEAVRWHLLGRPGEPDRPFELSKERAIEIYRAALDAVEAAGLPFQQEEIVLNPSEDLVTLVKKSLELAAAESDGGQ